MNEEATKENWINLANAIVRENALEYMAIYKHIKKGRHIDPRVMKSFKEIERFFHSQWYKELTDLDPDYLIDLLRARA